MAAIIIDLVISLLVSQNFIVLGKKQYRAEKPVTINTGEKPPREDELISVTEWNHRHGRNLIIFGCVLFITLSVFVFFIEKLDNVVLQAVIFILVLFVEIEWVEFEHNVKKKKMIKTKQINFILNVQQKIIQIDKFFENCRLVKAIPFSKPLR